MSRRLGQCEAEALGQLEEGFVLCKGKCFGDHSDAVIDVGNRFIFATRTVEQATTVDARVEGSWMRRNSGTKNVANCPTCSLCTKGCTAVAK